MTADSSNPPDGPTPGPDEDDKPGYCVTPKRTRWKKDDPSPNPRGRPRKPKTPDAIIEAASRALVTIKRNGKEIKVTRFEAMILKLYAGAFDGDRKAQTTLLSMRLKYARAEQKEFDNDDVVVEFGLIVNGQEQEEAPKQKRERKPRSTIRSRKNETRRETFSRVSALVANVNDNGVRRRMTYEQALWHMIIAAAVGGDTAAARLITRYMDDIIELESRKIEGMDEDGVIHYSLDLGKLPALEDDEE